MILCGTDLSVASEPALRAAAALAKKLGSDLLLVTVLERLEPAGQVGADAHLEREAGELRRTYGISVETSVERGAPEQRLLDTARERAVSLIVVGAEGGSGRSRRLGSVPEYLCQKSEEAWLAIWQHASRLNADLICMATHSRDAVRSLVIGSQAQAILQHSRIPVLFVPPDRED